MRERTGNRGLWTIDRGGDRGKLFEALLERGARFLIRLVGDRHLVLRGRPQAAEQIARGCPLPYAETVRRQNEDGTETILTITFGFRRVKLPGREEQLWLLVVRGFGQKPLMVLTTLRLKRTRASLWWAVEAYLTRWRIEDTLRFAKQTYATRWPTACATCSPDERAAPEAAPARPTTSPQINSCSSALRDPENRGNSSPLDHLTAIRCSLTLT